MRPREDKLFHRENARGRNRRSPRLALRGLGDDFSIDQNRGPHHPAGMAQRRRYLFVCVNRRPDGAPKGSCAARGSNEIHAALKSGLNARDLAKTEVRACTVSCLDVCWVGPTIAVEPDGYFYGRVTLADVPAIVDALAQGTRVERLVLAPEDFEMATAKPGLPARKE